MNDPELPKRLKQPKRATREEKLKKDQTKPDPSEGLGDSIKKVTDALGIKQCGGCKKRQEKLNRLFPYKNYDKKEE